MGRDRAPPHHVVHIPNNLLDIYLDSMKLGGYSIQVTPGVRHLDRQEFLIILP